MLIPLKNIPFSLVIEGLSGYKVLPFDKNNKQDILVLKNLKIIANEAGVAMNKNGILSRRVNEVGNYIESFVRVALSNVYAKAGIPITRSGKKKSTGYPDLLFYDEFGRGHYLECKTFNKKK